ncbi:hypothetical protein [Amycolatopsis decaplanina]|uniref:hypothetical protein n=1 Tax=Amycolatopsis decaplanina TaxID=208441 RepID=UPI000586A6ED|nr:hypothetical protein [Amycolatopsis decaplanina]
MIPHITLGTERRLLEAMLDRNRAERILFHHVLGGLPENECDASFVVGDASLRFVYLLLIEDFARHACQDERHAQRSGPRSAVQPPRHARGRRLTRQIMFGACPPVQRSHSLLVSRVRRQRATKRLIE